MIYLVGTYSKDKRHDSKIREYVEKASRRELAVFLGGVSENPQKARQFVQQAYQIDKGFVFCYESDIAGAIAGVLLDLGYCQAPNMHEEAEIGNLQTCYDLVTIDKVWLAWNSIPIHLSLRNDILQLLGNKKQTDAKQFINDIYGNHRNILKNVEWIEVYKHMFRFLKEMVPKQLRGPLNHQKISEYLGSNSNDGQEYIVYEINGKWRDSFIVKNIADTIKSLGLGDMEIYIFIGAVHIPEIEALMRKKVGNINIVEDAIELP